MEGYLRIIAESLTIDKIGDPSRNTKGNLQVVIITG